MPMPPSPAMSTTCLPGRASCAPIAMPTPWPTGASGPASRIWPGKRLEPLRDPAAHGKAVDHDGSVGIDRLGDLAGNACGMDRQIGVVVTLGLGDRCLESAAHGRNLGGPPGPCVAGPILPLRGLRELAQDQAGIAD